MISIIIPVYNEQENLPFLLEKISVALPKLGDSAEVILINDGSTDGSLTVMKGLKDKYPAVRVISFDRNCGQSAAFDCGFRSAKGDIIVTMDADLQNDPEDIPKLVDKLKSCDMVYGWRRNRRDPLHKLISSRVANFIRNSVTGERVRDTGCSLKAYKKHCLANIKLYDGMHRFLPTLARMEGFRAEEVEVSHNPRIYGRSKYNPWKRMAGPFLDLLAVAWMKKRHFHYKWEEL
ncbi:MAG TPA: glycosyltransferase family 2 protein [Spirochaetota bacterium]|nr:glycosyltransferase family 2 protein [Spirochaetota bacterium]